MNILITGSNGFIGKNLKNFIKDNYGYQILEFNKEDTLQELDYKIKNSDFIIHLAAVNRPSKKILFKETNIILTEYICKVLIKYSLNIPIIFSSSTQSELDNQYGKSKLMGEKLLFNLNQTNGNPVFIFRLPGVFGKWSKPYYNSVVSTFCFNAINNIELEINDKNKIINLVYIDDVLKKFCYFLDMKKKGYYFKEIRPSYKIKLNDLAKKILSFKHNRADSYIGNISEGLDRKLYSTYISFLNATQFEYPLKEHIDKRGKFVEVLKSKKSGQLAYFTAKPGITRGGHYHNSKTEKFIIVKGKAKFTFVNLANGEKVEINANSDHPKVIDSIPGWGHNIKNVGKDELIVLLWANEIFDPKNPDTYMTDL